jgi:hypothetical protein
MFHPIICTTEETRVEEKQKEFFCLSAGAYTTTWLVTGTYSRIHLLMCPSKIFRHGNKNTLSLVLVHSALFNNVCKAFILFLNKYVTEIQLPGIGILLLSIPQRFYTEF